MTARTATAAALDPNDALELSHLQQIWVAAYVIRFEGGTYRAWFRLADVTLEADTLAGIDSAVRAHWTRPWDDGGGTGCTPWDTL